MDLHTASNASSHTHPIRISLARFRVTAYHRNQDTSLVTLAENLRQATNRAKAYCDALEAGGSRDGIISVRVEQWTGNLTEGEWKPVSLCRGGFSHHFPKYKHQDGNHRNPSLPRTGDTVQCTLLGEKTRKGGWKARLAQRGTDGPITNTADVPKSAKPGETVVLRVGTVSDDGKRIQFHWGQADNAAC